MYLLHFLIPFHHARHYLGAAAVLLDRLDDHKHGRGTHFMHAVYAAQVPWVLAAVLTPFSETAYQLERRLKGSSVRGPGRASRSPGLCPICRIAAGQPALIIPRKQSFRIEAGSAYLAARGIDPRQGVFRP